MAMNYDQAKIDAIDALVVMPGDLFQMGNSSGHFRVKVWLGNPLHEVVLRQDVGPSMTVTLSEVWDALNRGEWRRSGSAHEPRFRRHYAVYGNSAHKLTTC